MNKAMKRLTFRVDNSNMYHSPKLILKIDRKGFGVEVFSKQYRGNKKDI